MTPAQARRHVRAIINQLERAADNAQTQQTERLGTQINLARPLASLRDALWQLNRAWRHAKYLLAMAAGFSTAVLGVYGLVLVNSSSIVRGVYSLCAVTLLILVATLAARDGRDGEEPPPWTVPSNPNAVAVINDIIRELDGLADEVDATVPEAATTLRLAAVCLNQELRRSIERRSIQGHRVMP